MSEKITVPQLSDRGVAGSTYFGSKAFKFISGAVVSTTAGGGSSIAVGLSDTFGFPMRADSFGQVQVVWNQSGVPYNKTNCFVAAATTAPATNTTGDVRGTIQVSTNGTNTAAPVQTAVVSNGTTRLTIVQNVGVWNTLFATPNNQVPMFGIPQA